MPKYGYYAHIVLKNRLRQLFRAKQENKYLFILSAPLCGSTLLNEILSTSSNVSTNNNWGTREGHKLPTTRQMMFDHDNRWNTDVDFDWQFINAEWRKYWDVSNPVLVEKSPPNIIRAKSIESAFIPSYFIILIRINFN